MEYRRYTTPAIIIARYPYGEANVNVLLLTRDHGLIRAHSQRSRDITSKLRFGLQLFSFSTVSLVRGKQRWRIVNVIPHRSYASRFIGKPLHMDIAAKLTLTLRHLVAGEEVDTELFHILYSTFNWLSNTQAHSREELQSVERIAILRILHQLGYIGSEEGVAQILNVSGYSTPLIEGVRQHQKRCTSLINNALNASHLMDTRSMS